ncbi:hypothetical protein [Streptomyces sp. NBC_01465]|uniref:hypothetical protein n=1 Tax=Streptomyces sp. NBC_01465 TaxID=2903878 RepID=UPI002E2F8210|nr:hypothetical protein [Streptomyces sp. NBC_01465]
MKQAIRRRIAVGALTTAVVLGGASAALARNGNGSIWVGNTYAHISGSVYWNPKGTDHGGMEVYGNLYDDEADGNSAKLEGKVSGYGYTTLWRASGGNGTHVYGDKVVYDPAALYVNDGYVQTCRYNSWGVDKCTSEYMSR